MILKDFLVKWRDEIPSALSPRHKNTDGVRRFGLVGLGFSRGVGDDEMSSIQSSHFKKTIVQLF